MRRILVFFFFIIVCAEASKCFKINESWKRCASQCEPTCETQNPSCSKSCTKSECQCNSGFYRDSRSGECLNKNQCAAASDAPPATCDTLACPELCNPGNGSGAFCYLIPEDPIPPSGPMCKVSSDCPPRMACIKGQHGMTCSAAKIDPIPLITCENMKCRDDEYCSDAEGFPKCVKTPVDPIPPSGTMCNVNSDCPPGMSCIKGKYGLTCESVQIDPRVPPTRPCTLLCIRGLKCYTDPYNGPVCKRDDGCGPNQEWKQCSNACFEKNCGDEQMSKQCSFVCGKPKCQCSKGFVREPNSKACIKSSQCPITTTAPTPITGPTIPPLRACNLFCIQGLKCATDPYNGPVCKKDDGCGPNQEWKQCSNACFEKNCGEEELLKQCSFDCGKPKCQCSEGFVREPNSKACIKSSRCPITTTTPTPITDNSIPCGKTRCPSSWTCQHTAIRCIRAPCPPDSYICIEPPTVSPSICGDSYCSSSEICETIRFSCTRQPCPSNRKVCVPKEGSSSPSPSACGPSLMCSTDEVCMVAMATCIRAPCPPPHYECAPMEFPTTTDPTTTTSGYGTGPSLPKSCAVVTCPRGQNCRMQTVRCYSPPCALVPICE